MSSQPAKIKVDFAIPGRSVYNLSHAVRFDTQPGTINAVTHIDVNPRERYEIQLSSLIKTFPTYAPILGRFKARIVAVYAPDRLYVPELRPNGQLMRQTVSDGVQVGANYPNIPFYAWDMQSGSTNNFRPDYPEEQERIGDFVPVVGKGSLFEQIGLPRGFYNREFGGDPIRFAGQRVLMYYDFFRNYIANPQEATFPVYSSADYSGSGTNFERFRFNALNRYYENMLWTRNFQSGDVDESYPLDRRSIFLDPYVDTIPDAPAFPSHEGWLYTPFGASWAGMMSARNGGLCLKTYQPDLNNVFVADALYQSAIARSIVSTTNGLDMSELLVGERLFDYFTKMAATGARFDEFIRAEFGVDITQYLDIPVYLRSWSFDVGFDDVVSTAATVEADGDQPLGSLAGRGLGGMSPRRNKKGRVVKQDNFVFTPSEYGTLAFYMWIEPYVDYYQGVDPMLTKIRFTDKFTPSMDRMGFQPLLLSQLNALGDTTNVTKDLYGNRTRWTDNPFSTAVGHQPAWQEYKGMVSRLMGDFTDELKYWTLARSVHPTDPTTYIEPGQFLYAFNDTNVETSQPFLVQVGFNIIAKRPISHRSLETFK